MHTISHEELTSKAGHKRARGVCGEARDGRIRNIARKKGLKFLSDGVLKTKRNIELC